MSFVLGNTIHITANGHIIEFDETGGSIGSVDPSSLSLLARAALTDYLEIYGASQLGVHLSGESRAATKRRAVSDRRKLNAVKDAAWRVARAIWQDRTSAAIAALVERLRALQPGWSWDGALVARQLPKPKALGLVSGSTANDSRPA